MTSLNMESGSLMKKDLYILTLLAVLLAPVAPQDPLVIELRILCRDEVALIEELITLVNQPHEAQYESGRIC